MGPCTKVYTHGVYRDSRGKSWNQA